MGAGGCLGWVVEGHVFVVKNLTAVGLESESEGEHYFCVQKAFTAHNYTLWRG